MLVADSVIVATFGPYVGPLHEQRHKAAETSRAIRRVAAKLADPKVLNPGPVVAAIAVHRVRSKPCRLIGHVRKVGLKRFAGEICSVHGALWQAGRHDQVAAAPAAHPRAVERNQSLFIRSPKFALSKKINERT